MYSVLVQNGACEKWLATRVHMYIHIYNRSLR